MLARDLEHKADGQLGLRKRDVNLGDGTILVGRSYDHDTTKGGHADFIPIAEPLLPFLEAAIRESPSALVTRAAAQGATCGSGRSRCRGTSASTTCGTRRPPCS